MNDIPYHNIINFFIKRNNFKSYLELGVRHKETFNNVECLDKTCVDIHPGYDPTYCMSTDTFFETLAQDKKWDIIFIDADHEKTQVIKDFDNSLKHLTEMGVIIMDDVNPVILEQTEPDKCFNAWEAFVELRNTRNDLEMYCIETSFCGIVKRGKQTPLQTTIIPTFDFLDKNRNLLLNLKKWGDICN